MEASNSHSFLSHVHLFVLFLLLCFVVTIEANSKKKVSALYVFGDSTVDPGNNNFIDTAFRSDFPPYGRDFVNQAATGRFTNGKLGTDFVASYLGLKELVPPYLDPNLSDKELVTGVSFASAGSGFDPLTPMLGNVIPIPKQLEYFKECKKRLEGMLGKKRTEYHINNALFFISAGTNDYVINYFSLPIRRKTYTTPLTYGHFLLQHVKDFIQNLWKEGARKIALVGVPPMGCLPIMITLNSHNVFLERGCVDKYSAVARDHNMMLQHELFLMQLNFSNTNSAVAKISYLDIYGPLDDMIQAHQNLGIAFIDAVRASCEHGKPPTSKIFGAVFHMLRTGKSLELIVGSYKLLVDLDKHFPRVYLSGMEDSRSPSNSPSKLVVVKEAWSPIIGFMDKATAVSEASDKQSGGSLDHSSFQALIEELAEILSETKFEAASMEPLRNMLIFQYLVVVFEDDFLPRIATLNWSMQRESLLSLLLGSRKINYKSLMKDFMAIMCQLSQLQSELSKHPVLQESSESKLSKNIHTALSLALLGVLKDTRVSMEKLLVMIMDLDMARKKADIEGHTTRGDSPRTPLMDIILDELAYSKDSVPVFLKVFSESKWKLEIVVQYLWKYITKPSVHTRKSNGHTEDATFDGALKCFSNKTGTKSLIKKIGVDVVQFLLAHGFQAHLSILSKGNAGDKQGGDSAIVDLCQTFISAFDSLRSTDDHMEILSIGKEALFTAATIIFMKS